MAKKKKGLGAFDYLIITLVLFVTVVCTIGYYLLILLPPLLLILGSIKNVFKMLSLPKVNSLKDFDLNSKEKEKLLALERKNDTFEKLLDRIDSKGASISKRKDGLYSEKSKLGKELNKQLNEIEPEYARISKEYRMLMDLPEKRKNNWLNIKSSFMAYLLSIPLFIFLVSIFMSKPNNFISLAPHYILIMMKTLSSFGFALIFLVAPSLENSWLANVYQFYPDYHLPMLTSSLITVVIYFLTKKIFFSTKKRGLGTIDKQDHIEIENKVPTKLNSLLKEQAKCSIEDNTKSGIKNEQDKTIDDSYNISKIKNGGEIEDNKSPLCQDRCRLN